MPPLQECGPQEGCLRPQQAEQEAHRLPPVLVPPLPGLQMTSLSLPYQHQDMAFKELFQKWPLLSLETRGTERHVLFTRAYYELREK